LYILRLLLSSLEAALSAIQLVREIRGAEVKAIYVGRDVGEGMFEVLMEIEGGAAAVDGLLASASRINGFLEGRVEELKARLIWEGLR